jgi:hypothetical protein
MMPLALIVALSGSVSNHWSRKSAADIVISWMNAVCMCRGRSRNCFASGVRGSHSIGEILPGSGGGTDRIGLMNRPISAISGPYSSYASASFSDQRRSSRTVLPWSFTRQR